MTEPSQYFKGRTVQEQMNEVIGYVDVRSAEVATDAIAADVAQVHSDAADAHSDALAAATSAAAAAGTLANAVKKTGEVSQSIAGDIAVGGDLSATGDLSVGGTGAFTGAVTVPDPVSNTDAANKKYVDDRDATKISITDINSYAVGLTGNQSPITGLKSHISNNCWEAVNSIPSNGFICKSSTDDVTTIPATEVQYPMIVWKDKNDQTVAMLRLEHKTSGQVFMMLYLKNTNGIAGYTNKELVRNQIV